MTNASAPQIVEPERLRALSHPLRLRLLEFLNDAGPATATECAHHTGESVASCSFHLRQLEKYGFVERAERRGREKPWRALLGSYSVRPDPEVPGSAQAAGALAALMIQSDTSAAVTSLNRLLAKQPLPGIPAADIDDWLAAATVTRSTVWLTREELAQVSAAFQQALEPFAGRTENSALPDGAVRVRTLGIALPDAAQEAETDE